jgi:hypothetical protein
MQGAKLAALLSKGRTEVEVIKQAVFVTRQQYRQQPRAYVSCADVKCDNWGGNRLGTLDGFQQ